MKGMVGQRAASEALSNLWLFKYLDEFATSP